MLVSRQHSQFQPEGHDRFRGNKQLHSSNLLGISLLTLVMLPRLHELVPYLVHIEPVKLVLILCVFLIFKSKKPIVVEWGNLVQTRLYIFFVIWLTVSSLNGVWPSSSMSIVVTFCKNILAYFILLKSLDSINDLYFIIRILLLSMVVFSVTILMNSVDGFRSTIGGLTLDGNEASLLIATTTPFMYYFSKYEKGIFRLVCYLGIFLGILAVLYTGSRGGVISLCIAMSYAYIVDKGNVFKKFLYIFVTIAIVLLLMPNVIKERFGRLGDAEQDYNLTSKHGRLPVWERAISVIEDKPIFGVGLGNFIFVESEVNANSQGVVAHNFVLQIAAETGIPGALLLLAFFYVSLRQLRFIKRKTSHSASHQKLYPVLSGLECAWLAFFVGGQFLSVHMSSQIIFFTSCSAFLWKCHLRGDFSAEVVKS